MKLRFDENLSPRLVGMLGDLFAGSLHVGQAGLARADDDAIWHFARDRGFAIVTEDSDFQERSQLAGSAPRIVWIRRGNCSTQDIEALLREHAARIAALEDDAVASFLVLLQRLARRGRGPWLPSFNTPSARPETASAPACGGLPVA